MQFSSRFKQLCKEKGITQKQALADMGMGRNAAQSWINGDPSLETIQKMAEYFEITTDEVLGVETKKTASPEGSGATYSDRELFEAIKQADKQTKEAILLLLKRK